MKKYFTIAVIFFFGISFSLFAKKVELKEARLAGKNFYFERISLDQELPYNSIIITGEFVEKVNEIPVYYIFNINDQGFIIVAADDAAYPVIGYSFETSYSPENQPEGFMFWMDGRKQEIITNIQNNLLPDEDINSTWHRLLSSDPSHLQDMKGTRVVEPLLTSNWDQIFPYNLMCPDDPGGPSGHVYVGCVATAMAQVMYYWRWPNQGQGYHCDTYQNYGLLCADFGNTTYDWNGTVNQPSKECDPVALISYHAGIAVDMNYGLVPGSAAFHDDISVALRTYFRYSNNCMFVKKYNYSSAGWNALLQADLDSKKPITYSGQGSGGGHAWVCDGYQGSDYYHFNWGWSGSANGYYYLSNLNPGGYNFTQVQQATVHIEPDPAQYPGYCSGQTTLDDYNFGTIEDGSGPVKDYQNSASCSWLIAPDDSIESITLNFIRFSTDPADLVKVYDGPSTSSSLLGTYSGTISPTSVASTGPEMLVTFTSNSSSTAPGFLASYNAATIPFCVSTLNMTGETGDLWDGSGRFNYRNSTSCKWKITPENASSVTVVFNNFNTEEVADPVKVYDMESSTPLAAYSGNYTTPPPPVTSNTGKMMVVFTSNSSIRGEGWDGSYSITVGTGETRVFKNLSVYPNPTDGFLNIHFTFDEIQSIKLELVSLKSEVIYSESLGNFKGTFDKRLDLSSYAKGVYLLKLTSDRGITNTKVVIQ